MAKSARKIKKTLSGSEAAKSKHAKGSVGWSEGLVDKIRKAHAPESEEAMSDQVNANAGPVEAIASMRVQLIQRCDACDGQGVVSSPAREEWHEKNERLHWNPAPWKDHPDNPMPSEEGPQEWPCCECDGKGEASRQWTLQELALMLNRIRARGILR